MIELDNVNMVQRSHDGTVWVHMKIGESVQMPRLPGEEFIVKLRKHRANARCPGNRIISGIDDINAEGDFCIKAEANAIKSNLTLKELRHFKSEAPESVILASKVLTLCDCIGRHSSELKTEFSGFVKTLGDMQDYLMQKDNSVDDFEIFKNIMKRQKDIETAHDLMENAVQTILESWFN